MTKKPTEEPDEIEEDDDDDEETPVTESRVREILREILDEMELSDDSPPKSESGTSKEGMSPRQVEALFRKIMREEQAKLAAKAKPKAKPKQKVVAPIEESPEVPGGTLKDRLRKLVAGE